MIINESKAFMARFHQLLRYMADRKCWKCRKQNLDCLFINLIMLVTYIRIMIISLKIIIGTLSANYDPWHFLNCVAQNRLLSSVNLVNHIQPFDKHFFNILVCVGWRNKCGRWCRTHYDYDYYYYCYHQGRLWLTQSIMHESLFSLARTTSCDVGPWMGSRLLRTQLQHAVCLEAEQSRYPSQSSPTVFECLWTHLHHQIKFSI